MVASINPVKINAARQGFGKMFPKKTWSIKGYQIASQVSRQPMTSRQTLKGAMNRVENAIKSYKDFNYYVGIEGGIKSINQDMYAFAWVVVADHQRISKSETNSFLLPNPVTELIKEGRELGDVMDILFSKKNVKQKQGAIGILTEGLIDRTMLYIPAIITALIPFKKPELYEP